MISNIHNENFGYDVSCYGVWTAIGNPNLLRFNPSTSSLIRTGSVEVYRYNINTDTHDKKSVLYRPLSSAEFVLISTEDNNISPTGPDYILHTEPTGSFPITADLDLLLDSDAYYTASEDGYGFAVDINKTLLVVGDPYFSSSINTTSQSFIFSSSIGTVDIFDLSKLDIDPFAPRQNPYITSTSSLGGFIQVNVFVPAAQQFGFVVLESTDNLNNPFQKVNIVSVSNAGGPITIPTTYTVSPGFFRISGIVSNDPYLITLSNPHSTVTQSFGYSVSINDEWIAVGSTLESGSKGSVFMFRKQGGPFGNDASWSYYQSINPPSDIVAGDAFGHAVSLNKCSGSFSGSMIIGSLKPSSSRAYVYGFNGSTWNKVSTLNPDNNTIYPLTFYPINPVFSGSFPNLRDGFGYDVSIFHNTIVVGAPYDRTIYEYSGSSVYKQGSVYFFENCSNGGSRYYLARKSYGNEKTIKNNVLGFSVFVCGEHAVVGCPKTNFESASICYLRGSLFQQHFCSTDNENSLQGQFILYHRISGSIPDTTGVDWEITNVYQVKKRLLQPYRSYGFDVSICDDFVTIGAPMLISGSSRTMDLNSSTGSFTGSLSDIGDLAGKAYIYNLKNLRDQFYVGNVFYRNGKIVLMSSGSAFDGLLLNSVASEEFEYDVDFKSKQLLYEKQIVCPVEPGEFNVSTNPTAIMLPTSSFDINKNGKFDFQDADVLLRYMKYKSTETAGTPITDWSSSLINLATDEELSVYNMYFSQWEGTDVLFTNNFSNINNSLFVDLDFNEDNKIDLNDMSILWRYFIYRLTQKNYETYITPSSKKKFLSDIIDFLNSRTLRNKSGVINSNFLDFKTFSKNDPTGSYLAPYVTSIGLYNGAELVSIAKLGSPIKITPDFPINFVVKMDF